MNNETASKVYELLTKIPEGRVTTYGELARAVGSKAPRAIGRILNVNPNAPTVPCHRVVMSNGSLGGYAFGAEQKSALLKAEGVEILDGHVHNFKEKLFRFSAD